VVIVWVCLNPLSPQAAALGTITGVFGTLCFLLSLKFFKSARELIKHIVKSLWAKLSIAIKTLKEALRQKLLGTRPIPLSPLMRRVFILAWFSLSVFLTIVSCFNLVRSLSHSSVIVTCKNGGTQIASEQDSLTTVTESIGISDGCYFFTHTDSQMTAQAEADIYKQNPLTNRPHITLVIATMLTGVDQSSLGAGESLLQGADIAQKEYNSHLKSGQLPLRLLIANTGSNERAADIVAQQIVQLAQTDHTILGVMGWPFSTPKAEQAISILGHAHISSVSPALSSNKFTNISPYFFRIVSPDLQQGIDGATFAKTSLDIKHVVIYVDYSNLYSVSLADSFSAAFADQDHTVTIEKYTRNTLSGDLSGRKAATLAEKAHADFPLAEPFDTDAIYFAGYANDLDPLRGYFISHYPLIKVMGGDGLDEYKGYSASNFTNYRQIYFTTFSYYDTWNYLNITRPCFFQDYRETFNMTDEVQSPYYALAEDDAMLSYDATASLLEAYKHLNINTKEIQQALAQTNFLGVSGQIIIGPENDPMNKAVIMIQVGDHGDASILHIFGQFAPNGLTLLKTPLCP
jgi:ABC-type branched-subunit amino acid transport system substrate-binding protein